LNAHKWSKGEDVDELVDAERNASMLQFVLSMVAASCQQQAERVGVANPQGWLPQQ